MDLTHLALEILAGIFLLWFAFELLKFVFRLAVETYHLTVHQMTWKPKVGDRCYFINIMGTRTVFTIDEIEDDKLHCIHRDSYGRSSQWLKRDQVSRI